MKKIAHWTAAVTITAMTTTGALAAPMTYDLRSFFDGVLTANAGSVPAQSPGNLWTFHAGTSANGFLGPNGSFYGLGNVPGGPHMVGPVVNAADASWNYSCGGASTPSFNGLWVHPNSGTPSGIVLHIASPTVIDSIEIQYETTGNGCAGNGLTIGASILGANPWSNTPFAFTSATGRNNAATYTPGLTVGAGAQVQILIGDNGSYLYDHSNINVIVRTRDIQQGGGGNPVSEPATLALLGAGLLGLAAVRRRN